MAPDLPGSHTTGTCMHIIKSWHFCFYIIVTTLLSSSIVLGGVLHLQKLETPVVFNDEAGKCQQVINYTNGDAFTCGDVGLTLRRYRTELATAESVDPNRVTPLVIEKKPEGK
jgi:hypothetical protein